MDGVVPRAVCSATGTRYASFAQAPRCIDAQGSPFLFVLPECLVRDAENSQCLKAGIRIVDGQLVDTLSLCVQLSRATASGRSRSFDGSRSITAGCCPPSSVDVKDTSSYLVPRSHNGRTNPRKRVRSRSEGRPLWSSSSMRSNNFSETR